MMDRIVDPVTAHRQISTLAYQEIIRLWREETVQPHTNGCANDRKKKILLRVACIPCQF